MTILAFGLIFDICKHPSCKEYFFSASNKISGVSILSSRNQSPLYNSNIGPWCRFVLIYILILGTSSSFGDHMHLIWHSNFSSFILQLPLFLNLRLILLLPLVLLQECPPSPCVVFEVACSYITVLLHRISSLFLPLPSLSPSVSPHDSPLSVSVSCALYTCAGHTFSHR